MDVSEFHSLCPIMSFSARHAGSNALIESLLKNLPPILQKPLHDDEECNENSENLKDRTEAILLKINKELTDYIPYKKQHWDEAVERIRFDPAELAAIFNFSSITAQQKIVTYIPARISVLANIDVVRKLVFRPVRVT